MFIAKNKLIVSICTIPLFFTACVHQEDVEPRKNKEINNYISKMKSLEKKGGLKESENFSTKKYIEDKTVISKKEIYIKKGDNLKNIINEIIKVENKIYILEGNFDYIFKKDIEVSFKNIKSLIRYVNFSSIYDFELKIETSFDLQKLKIIYPNSVQSKLNKIPINTLNSISHFNVLKELTSSLDNVSINIDRYSRDLLSQGSQESYSGNALDYIKDITDRENLFLSFTENTIKISHLKSKVFDILITPLMINTSSKSSLEIEESASVQSSNIDFGYKIYDELENNIKNIIGKKGMYFLNKASGQLTVRAERDNLELAEEVIEKFNEMYSRQVKIDIEILEVTLNEEHKNGVDFKALLSNDQLDFTTPFSTAGNILGSQLIYKKTDGSKNALIQSMNVFGEVSVTSKPTLITLNSIPSLIDVGIDVEYVSKINKTEATLTSGPSYVTENSNAKDGLKMFVYPRIIEGDKILLTLSPSISSVIDLQEVAIGDTMIKTKTMNNRTFSSTLVINNNDTALLAGLMTSYNKKNKDGLPFIAEEDEWTDLIGGTKYSKNVKTELLIIITANIINLK